jgi:amino acid transporter
MVNCVSVKLGNVLGYIFNFGKIAGLLMIIFFGIYGFLIGRTESFSNSFENSASSISRYAIAFNAGCFAYGGWSSLNNLVGEMKNPNK